MSDDATARILATLERLEVGQAGLRDGQAQLRTEFADVMIRTRAELMARMDRLQDAIVAIRGDSTVNFDRSDHVQRNSGNVCI